MKTNLLLLLMTLFFVASPYGQILVGQSHQGLFYFGEKSYPCTKSIELSPPANFTPQPGQKKPNELLKVLIAKDGTNGLFVCKIKTSSSGILIRGKLMIYLDDGTVIACVDSSENDYVDNISTTVYHLTTDELTKMKKSNVHTVRYSLKCPTCSFHTKEEGNFTSKNINTIRNYDLISSANFPTLIKNLFD